MDEYEDRLTFIDYVVRFAVIILAIYIVISNWTWISSFIPWQLIPVSPSISETVYAGTPDGNTVSTPALPELPTVTNDVQPTMLVEPTPFVWPSLDPNALSPQSAAETTGPLWCPYSDLWIGYTDYTSLATFSFWNTPGFFLERILLEDGSIHFRGMPFTSVVHPDGISYAHHPVCIDSVVGFPDINNLDGLATTYTGAGGLSLQLRSIPLCVSDPATGIGCSGTFLEKSLGNGLFAYPVNVVMLASNPTPIIIGPDFRPQTIISTVIHLDSWITHPWAAGPNYSVDFFTSNDQFVVTFVTQEGIGRNVNLLPIKTWWRGTENDQIVFGSCNNVPQGVEIPGRPGMCITHFNFQN